MSLKDEKAILNYSHSLELKRIWLEKLLIGALIVLAGFTANIVLERYKSDLAKSQYLLDKRVEALTEMRANFSKLTTHAYHLMYTTNPEKTAGYLKEYKQDINTFIDHGNEWGFLFSDNFDAEVNQYMWIHEAAAQGQIKLTLEHENFVDSISAAFDSATKTALAVEVFGNPQPSQTGYFHLKRWTPAQVHLNGLDKFFLENFSEWKKNKPP